MADVVDKGVGAALFMALSHTLIRASAEQQVSLSDSEFVHDVVKLTSDYIATHHSGSMFVTLFFGVLDIHTGLLTYVNAGHNPPLVVNSAGAVKSELKPTGPAVGLFPFLDFDSQQLTFEPGDLLMTFTDGVPEARGPDGEFFGEERLLSLLQEPASSASTLLDRVEASLQDHLGDAEQSDDVTMLAVRRAPTSEV
jgi:sigma-B regulation protein RsbU (phosphoserine phosphatase)